MSGARRVFSSTDGSIFLASAKAAALSSTADRLVRNCTKMGTEILYMEMAVIAHSPSFTSEHAFHTRLTSLGHERAFQQRGLDVLPRAGRMIERHAGETVPHLRRGRG